MGESTRRGRPAKAQNQVVAEIIQATLDQLIEKGYAATTIESVSKRAHIAKKTIYRFFTDRDELIRHSLGKWSCSFAVFFQQDAQTPEECKRLLKSGLEQVAEEVLSPQAVAIFRLLQHPFPDRERVLQWYREQGIQHGRSVLCGWLQRQSRHQVIAQLDYQQVADLVLSMVIAEPLRVLALREQPETLISQRIDMAVDFIWPSLQHG